MPILDELIAIEPEFQAAKRAFYDFTFNDPAYPTRREIELFDEILACCDGIQSSRNKLLQQVERHLLSKNVVYGSAFIYKGYVIAYNDSGVQVFNQIGVE
jgi:hypothetical protein